MQNGEINVYCTKTGEHSNTFYSLSGLKEIGLTQDESKLIVFTETGTIHLIDIPTGEKIQVITLSNEINTWEVLGHSDEIVLSTNDNLVYKVNLFTGSVEQLGSLGGRHDLHLCPSNAHNSLLMVSFGRIQFMKMDQHNKIKTISTHVEEDTKSIYGYPFAISQDEQFFLSAKNTYLEISFAKDGSRKHILDHDSMVTRVAFVNDDHFVISGSFIGKKIKVWDVASGELVHEFLGEDFYVAEDQNRLLVITTNGIDVWELSDVIRENESFQLQLGANINTILLTPDNKKIVWYQDGIRAFDEYSRLRLVDRDKQSTVTIDANFGSSYDKFKIDISQDGTHFTTFDQNLNYAYVRDIEDRGKTVRLPFENKISTTIFSPDGKSVVAGLIDGTIIKEDIFSGSTNINLSQNGEILSLDMTDAKSLVAGLMDGTIVEKVGSKSVYLGHTEEITCLDMLSNHSIIVSGSKDKTVNVWKENGTCIQTFSMHQSTVLSVAISPDGKFVASSSNDGTVYLWNIKTGEIINHYQTNLIAKEIYFSPNASNIYVTSTLNGKWLSRGELKGILLETNLLIDMGYHLKNGSNFSKKGSYLAFGEDSFIKVLHLKTKGEFYYWIETGVRNLNWKSDNELTAISKSGVLYDLIIQNER